MIKTYILLDFKVRTDEMFEIRLIVFERDYFNDVSKTRLIKLTALCVHSRNMNRSINYITTMSDHYCLSDEEESMISCNYYGLLFDISSNLQEHLRDWCHGHSKN